MNISWNQNLSIGVEEIDNQHKELVKKINDLINACNEKRGKEEVGKIVDFLGEYVIKHFTAEEKIQREYKYPNYDQHKALHTKFINDLGTFKSQFEKEGPTLNFIISINVVLSDWLINHISKEDKKIGLYINSLGK